MQYNLPHALAGPHTKLDIIFLFQRFFYYVQYFKENTKSLNIKKPGYYLY